MEIHKIAVDIWEWAICRHIMLSAAHIPGVENVEPDSASRVFKANSEWMLNKELFDTSLKSLCLEPHVDLFASRLNKQLPKYVSYCPDPSAMAIDAFNVKWHGDVLYYMFPPFSVIPACLQKAAQEQATAILVVPYWTPQPWYPILLRMMLQPPLLLPPSTTNLVMMSDLTLRHPLASKMNLLVCHLSGDTTGVLACQGMHRKSFWDPERIQRSLNMSDL